MKQRDYSVCLKGLFQYLFLFFLLAVSRLKWNGVDVENRVAQAVESGRFEELDETASDDRSDGEVGK